MLPLARLGNEPKSGAIFVYLFVPATLNYFKDFGWGILVNRKNTIMDRLKCQLAWTNSFLYGFVIVNNNDYHYTQYFTAPMK
jgi:hypothetical protein